MGKIAFIERLDRLSVRSPMRGSTSSLCGLLGSALVLLLLLVYYAPVANEILKGDYYTT